MVQTRYDIVKAHSGTIIVNTFYSPPGGEIKVESAENEGAEFIIQLPFTKNGYEKIISCISFNFRDQ